MNYTRLIELFQTEILLVVAALVVLAADIAFLRRKSHGLRVGVAVAISSVAILAALGLTEVPASLKGGYEEYSRTIAEADAEDTKAKETPVSAEVLKQKKAQIRAKFYREENAKDYGIGVVWGWNNPKSIVLVLGLLTFLLIAGTSRMKNPAEHVAVTLFALAGITLMCVAQNLLVIFLAVELASLSLYVLAGFDKTRPESAEAGLKYFLYGGTAAAFLLFGLSLIYGLTGELGLAAVGIKLAALPPSPLLVIAMSMVFVGFGYKVAAAPFHLWAPDTYQGAPTTSAALIASASKVGGFVLLASMLRAFSLEGPDSSFALQVDSEKLIAAAPIGGSFVVLAVLIVASLLLGNVAALVQSNVRRLLAYSAIAHAGVLLIAAQNCTSWKIAGFNAWSNLLYYLLTYGLATVGAFGVVAVLENNGGCQKISDLKGLWWRSRLLTGTLLVFILSLAGVPPLAGFFAKFRVFLDGFQVSGALPGATGTVLFGVVLLGVAMSAVALYYYLQILKAAFVANPEKGTASATPVKVPWPAAVALVLAAAGLVVLSVIAARPPTRNPATIGLSHSAF